MHNIWSIFIPQIDIGTSFLNQIRKYGIAPILSGIMQCSKFINSLHINPSNQVCLPIILPFIKVIPICILKQYFKTSRIILEGLNKARIRIALAMREDLGCLRHQSAGRFNVWWYRRCLSLASSLPFQRYFRNSLNFRIDLESYFVRNAGLKFAWSLCLSHLFLIRFYFQLILHILCSHIHFCYLLTLFRYIIMRGWILLNLFLVRLMIIKYLCL